MRGSNRFQSGAFSGAEVGDPLSNDSVILFSSSDSKRYVVRYHEQQRLPLAYFGISTRKVSPSIIARNLRSFITVPTAISVFVGVHEGLSIDDLRIEIGHDLFDRRNDRHGEK